jgi:hypothetical protein
VNFKPAALVASTSLVLGLAGCGHIAPASGVAMSAQNMIAAAKAHRAAQKGGTWTVLIHMAAENNLYNFGLEDINEMEAGIPADGSVKVFVLFDGIKDGDSCIYNIKHDSGMNTNIISEKLLPGDVIPSNHEIDSGSADQMIKFVQWAAKNAPADHTLAAVWDHGSGLFNGNPNPITKGFGWDDGSGNNMHTSDLSRITGAFKAAAGKNLDAFGFDCCLMSHSEIAYQMAGNCDYLVASEELEPGKGWDYQGWLKAVGTGDHTPTAVVSALVDTYAASYQPGGSQSSGRDSATLAATDINALTANVVPALNEFVAAATADMASNKAAINAARSKTQTFYNRDCADLGNFLANLKPAVAKNAALSASIAKLQAAYASTIVREGHTKNYPGATGNVIYFPTGGAINSAYLDAKQIAFAKESWKDFLKAIK